MSARMPPSTRAPTPPRSKEANGLNGIMERIKAVIDSGIESELIAVNMEAIIDEKLREDLGKEKGDKSSLERRAVITASKILVEEAERIARRARELIEESVTGKGIIQPSRLDTRSVENTVSKAREVVARAENSTGNGYWSVLDTAVGALNEAVILYRRARTFNEQALPIMEKTVTGSSISLGEAVSLLEYYDWGQVYEYVAPEYLDVEVPEKTLILLLRILDGRSRHFTPRTFIMTRNYVGFIGEHVLVAWRHGGAGGFTEHVLVATSTDEYSGFHRALREASVNRKLRIEVNREGLLVNGVQALVRASPEKENPIARLLEDTVDLVALKAYPEYRVNIALVTKTFINLVIGVSTVDFLDPVGLRDNGNIVFTGNVEVENRLTGLRIIGSTGTFGFIGVQMPEIAIALHRVSKVKSRNTILVYGALLDKERREYREAPILLIADYGEPGETKIMVSPATLPEPGRDRVIVREAIKVKKPWGAVSFIESLHGESTLAVFNYNGRIGIMGDTRIGTGASGVLVYLGPEKSWRDKKNGPLKLVDNMNAVRALARTNQIPVDGGTGATPLYAETMRILRGLGKAKRIASLNLFLTGIDIRENIDGVLLVYDRDRHEYNPVHTIRYADIAWFIRKLIDMYPAKTAIIDAYELDNKLVFKAMMESPSGVEIIGFSTLPVKR